ncbi:MAG: hypothetical protein ACREL5_01110 [Gemmatimonadales bacterium]
MKRLFLLSPASTAGKRAQLLLRSDASFDLAVRIRRDGVPLGEVFSFLSGLYFRGKLAYARRFATTRDMVRIITSDRGLVDPHRIVGLADLRQMSLCTIDHRHPPYRDPLLRDAVALGARLGTRSLAVLLGSIATEKYVAVLGDAFGQRLVFPAEFVGRGDMSRGGLMLRQARAGVELEYCPIATSERRGRRPARLAAATEK